MIVSVCQPCAKERINTANHGKEHGSADTITLGRHEAEQLVKKEREI